MGSIFGGSKSNQTASSSNQFAQQLNTQFSPLTAQAGNGANALSALLGGDASGLNAYKGATGFDAAAEQGSRGITGNAAASGLLRSGSTAKGLQAFGNNLQNSYAQSYMDKLLAQAGLGLQAGNLISGAGQTSQSQGTSSKKDGLGGLIGSVASGIAASDRRLKKNIHKVGERDGLNIYQYRYVDGTGPMIGVMADEVEKLYPEALGPTIEGYQSVDYDKLKEVMNGV